MDKGLLKGDEPQEGGGEDENSNQYKAAYYSTMLDNSSSDEEEGDGKEGASDHGEGDEGGKAQTPSDEVKSEDEEEEEEDAYNLLEDNDDDDFEEFQSSETFQPMTSVTGAPPSVNKSEGHMPDDPPLPPSSIATVDPTGDQGKVIPPQLPADRIAPLTADHIAKIKVAMGAVKISARSGPILDVVNKLEGARLGDEQEK